MDEIKKIEKDGTVGKDRAIDLSNEVQELTDDYIKKIDELYNDFLLKSLFLIFEDYKYF